MNAAETAISALLPDVYADEDPVHEPARVDVIPEGQRDHTLASLAGSMRRKGFTPEAIAAALTVVNEQQVRPMLPARDIERIARSVGRYAPERVSAAPIGTAVAAETIRFRTAAEISSQQPAVPKWIVPGFSAPGVITEWDGKLKASGKTTLIAHKTKAVLTGAPFLGRPTRHTAVVLLTEERETTLHETLKRAGLDTATNLHILYWHEVKGLPWPVVVNAAVEKALAVGAEQLVVDTVGQFAGLRGESENNSGDALAAVEPLQMAAAKGLAVDVVRHERKGGGEVGESGRGSSAFSAAVDIIVSIRRAEGNTKPTVRVLQTLSRFSETPESLVIELTEQGYIALGTKGTVAVMEAEKAILDMLPSTSETAMALKDMCEHSTPHIKRTVAQEALENLEQTGVITKIGSGKKGSAYRWFRTVEVSAGTQITRCGRNPEAVQ